MRVSHSFVQVTYCYQTAIPGLLRRFKASECMLHISKEELSPIINILLWSILYLQCNLQSCVHIFTYAVHFVQ